MKRGVKKFVTLVLVFTALVFSGLVTAQEAPSAVDGIRTATVKEMQIAGSYVYVLANEEGEEVWLATTPGFVKDISYGDTIEFLGEVEMQGFHSKGLGKTFNSIWFISQIRVKQDDTTEDAAE